MSAKKQKRDWLGATLMAEAELAVVRKVIERVDGADTANRWYLAVRERGSLGQSFSAAVLRLFCAHERGDSAALAARLREVKELVATMQRLVNSLSPKARTAVDEIDSLISETSQLSAALEKLGEA